MKQKFMIPCFFILVLCISTLELSNRLTSAQQTSIKDTETKNAEKLQQQQQSENSKQNQEEVVQQQQVPLQCKPNQFLNTTTNTCVQCSANCDQCCCQAHCYQCAPGFYRVLTGKEIGAHCSITIPKGFVPDVSNFYEINADILGSREHKQAYALAYNGKAIISEESNIPYQHTEQGPVSEGKKVRVDVRPCKKLCKECSAGFALDPLSNNKCISIEKCFTLTKNGVLVCSDPMADFVGKIISKPAKADQIKKKEEEKKKKEEKKKAKKGKDQSIHSTEEEDAATKQSEKQQQQSQNDYYLDLGSLSAVTNRDEMYKNHKVTPLTYYWTIHSNVNGTLNDVTYHFAHKARRNERSVKISKQASIPVAQYTVNCVVSHGNNTLTLEHNVQF